MVYKFPIDVPWIYALGARPGTVRKEIIIDLPERNSAIKREPRFHNYRDELMQLLRVHGKEAAATTST